MPFWLTAQRSPALPDGLRSEEHTSELQSRLHLVCRLLLEKKKKNIARVLKPNLPYSLLFLVIARVELAQVGRSRGPMVVMYTDCACHHLLAHMSSTHADAD